MTLSMLSASILPLLFKKLDRWPHYWGKSWSSCLQSYTCIDLIFAHYCPATPRDILGEGYKLEIPHSERRGIVLSV